ncbi:hypothetical protein BGAPBR_K0010 (plasmid) [Borreliella garinii PBr]|uniref:Uncharacterized protein n=1 Tax=Borreliella garinii PBr TaxID=498743 RepID=B8F0P3_BORGR|nr:hypothetical protein BGAPBR_K0010 [Borreliella garinii PBr]
MIPFNKIPVWTCYFLESFHPKIFLFFLCLVCYMYIFINRKEKSF